MGKLFAILAASAVVAGGATFAFVHHINPYNCPLSSCEVSKAGCCATPTADAESPPAPAVAAAGPVAMFATVPVSAELSCCATKPVTAARASCCSAGAACCATGEVCCAAPGIAAVVGPAAAVR